MTACTTTSRIPRSAPRRAALGAAAAALWALVVATPALAEALPVRTFRISANGQTSTNGIAGRPALSGDGRVIAFDSTAFNWAPDENGPVRDVFTLATATGARHLVSQGAGGAPGNAASFGPAVSDDGRTVAFVSDASNLAPGDTNGMRDVFVRRDGGAVMRVSVGSGGVEANGVSEEPVVSGDGRHVAFSSRASNLVGGDDNDRRDIFVRDLATGVTERVTTGAGQSSAPAISGNGRYVTFFSSSSDLVDDDDNRVGDVFVADRARGEFERVSVSSDGDEQNNSVIDPFSQVSDISADGRYVVFDSDATTLVPRDRNRDTDVFLRDRRRDTTTRVSLSSEGEEGDNDSFAPSISADGRFVAFESFADNLVEGSAAREDAFVRDRRLQATSLLTVSSDGEPRGSERVRQHLQRPQVSNTGFVGLFTSTADGLTPGDANGVEDVFLRRLDPPAASARVIGEATGRRVRLDLDADDERADRFLCRLNGRGASFLCKDGTNTLPRRHLREGRNRLTVRAGGLGMLWSRAETLEVGIELDRRRPTVSIRRPRGSSVRTIRGTARDRGSGVRRVEVAVVFLARDGRCRSYDGRAFVRSNCDRFRYSPATGKRSWRLRLPASIRGPIAIRARAIDEAGNRSRRDEFRGVLL